MCTTDADLWRARFDRPFLVMGILDSFNPLDVVGGIVDGIFASKSAQRDRHFQQDMSNTAHQRAVKDLRAAGLNPILSARYGGASTPPGSTAKANLAASMRSVALIKAEREKIENEAEKVKQDTKTSASNAWLNAALAEQAKQQAATAKELQRKYAHEANILSEREHAEEIKGDIASSAKGYVSKTIDSVEDFVDEVIQDMPDDIGTNTAKAVKREAVRLYDRASNAAGKLSWKKVKDLLKILRSKY